MKRKPCPKSIKDKLLKEQDNKCLYCHLPLINPVFDHIIPYAYLQSNPISNWAAVCNTCNLIKSSLVFNSVQEISNYVITKQLQKNLPRMSTRLYSSTKRQEILRPEMQVCELGQTKSAQVKSRKVKSRKGRLKKIKLINVKPIKIKSVKPVKLIKIKIIKPKLLKLIKFKPTIVITDDIDYNDLDLPNLPDLFLS